MRCVSSLTALVLVGIGLSNTSAQVTAPADPRVHAVIGVVTQVTDSSFRLRANNGERELKVDKSTSVAVKGASLTNDLVWRERKTPPKLADFMRVGDEARVSYRDDAGVLTALRVAVTPQRKAVR
jgi:hypothetical protein